MSVALMMDALADQIQDELCGTANPVIVDLQVENRLHPNPTPPAIDIYPGTPFTEAIGYGHTRQYWFTVRARVSMADNEAGQDLLLSMMDNATNESVEAAIRSTKTYASAQLGDVEGPTEFGVFPDSGGEGNLLGCTWRVALIP